MPTHHARRLVLGALLTAPLAACAAPSAVDRPATTVREVPALAELERRFGVRLGVFARNTITGVEVRNRDVERFAMCSTFKAYAVGALLHLHPLRSGYFERRIPIVASDIIEHCPVTGAHVGGELTIAQLCEATITVSDNAAANLLLRELGGPAGLTRFARRIGDPVTRLDRWETELNSALRGDLRDTSTPAAIGNAYRTLVLGDVLGGPERELLRRWLIANTTSATKVRAGLPPGWVVGDKTGGGDFATSNDIAITWSDRGHPIVLALMSDKPVADAEPDSTLLAEATRAVIAAVR